MKHFKALIFLPLLFAFSSKAQRIEIPFEQRILKAIFETYSQAPNPVKGLKRIGEHRDPRQTLELFKMMRAHPIKKGSVTKLSYSSNKALVWFGPELISYEIVDAQRGRFKINNRLVTIKPQMSPVEAARILDYRTSTDILDLKKQVPQGHKIYQDSNAHKLALLALASLNVVDMYWKLQMLQTQRQISDSKLYCESSKRSLASENSSSLGRDLASKTWPKQYSKFQKSYEQIEKRYCSSKLLKIYSDQFRPEVATTCKKADSLLSCVEGLESKDNSLSVISEINNKLARVRIPF